MNRPRYTDPNELVLGSGGAAVSARDAERELGSFCLRLARAEEEAIGPRNAREANVVRVAAMLLRPRHTVSAARPRDAAERYFESRPDERLGSNDVVRAGWLIGLPRFRALLESGLESSP